MFKSARLLSATSTVGLPLSKHCLSGSLLRAWARFCLVLSFSRFCFQERLDSRPWFALCIPLRVRVAGWLQTWARSGLLFLSKDSGSGDDSSPGLDLLPAFHLKVCVCWLAGDLGKVLSGVFLFKTMLWLDDWTLGLGLFTAFLKVRRRNGWRLGQGLARYFLSHTLVRVNDLKLGLGLLTAFLLVAC